jgi:hypothetical protein
MSCFACIHRFPGMWNRLLLRVVLTGLAFSSLNAHGNVGIHGKNLPSFCARAFEGTGDACLHRCLERGHLAMKAREPSVDVGIGIVTAVATDKTAPEVCKKKASEALEGLENLLVLQANEDRNFLEMVLKR